MLPPDYEVTEKPLRQRAACTFLRNSRSPPKTPLRRSEDTRAGSMNESWWVKEWAQLLARPDPTCAVDEAELALCVNEERLVNPDPTSVGAYAAGSLIEAYSTGVRMCEHAPAPAICPGPAR